MRPESWSEIVKDVIVSVCVIVLTIAGVRLEESVRVDVRRVAAATERIEVQTEAFVQEFRERTVLDEEVQAEAKGALRNLNAMSGEGLALVREARGAVRDARVELKRTSASINDVLVPELVVQVQGIGEEARLVLREIRGGVATFDLEARDVGAAAERLLRDVDGFVLANEPLFEQLLRDVDTVAVNVGEGSGEATEILREVNVWTKDTLKRRNLVIRIAAGLVGAVLPRIIQ